MCKNYETIATLHNTINCYASVVDGLYLHMPFEVGWITWPHARKNILKMVSKPVNHVSMCKFNLNITNQPPFWMDLHVYQGENVYTVYDTMI